MRDLFKRYKPIIFRANLISPENLDKYLSHWKKEYGNGKEAKNNVIGKILKMALEAIENTLSKVQISHQDFIKYNSRKREILCLIFQYYNDMGFNISDINAQINYCDLLRASTNRFKMTATLMTSQCCPECRNYDGETVTLEEMIENPVLPIKDCIRERGCFCWYALSAERSENDGLYNEKLIY